MYTAEIQFKRLRKCSDEDADDKIDTLILALHQNGQVLSEYWPTALRQDTIRAFVLIPERTALQRKHENKWIKKAKSQLAEVGLSQPKAEVLSREVGTLNVCKCKRPAGYLLYTDFVSLESPLRCAACFDAVPFYRIPHTSDWDTYEDIIFWRHNYHACDLLQTLGAVGERFNHKQLGQLDTALTQSGLECCQTIRKLTKQPCYYYLYRHHGRSHKAEAQRKCPSCNKRWLLDQPWHDKFDFRCDRCQLVSNIAYGLV